MSGRRKIALIGLIVLTALIVVGLYFYFLQNKETPEAPPATEGTFPFGTGAEGELGGDETTDGVTDGTVIPEDSDTSVYRRIGNDFVAGMVWVEGREEGKSGTLRYMERTTGHIYETAPPFASSSRVSNTTIPAIRKVEWSQDPNIVGIQHEEEGFVGASVLIIENKESQSDEVTLPSYTTSLSGSPVNGDFAFLTTDPNGSVVYTISSPEEETEEIAALPITDLKIDWISPSTILISSKASSSSAGSAYILNPTTQTLSYVIGGIQGLSATLSGNLSRLLYSKITSNRQIELRILNRTTNDDRALPVSTLAEKCVWSTYNEAIVYCAVPREFPRGTYPDDWYKGKVSFSDQIWQINTETGELELLLVPSDFSRPNIDATHLTLSENDEYLFFINKKDSSLWSLRIR